MALYCCIIFKLMFPVSFILDTSSLFLTSKLNPGHISNPQAPPYLLLNLSKAELKIIMGRCVCVCTRACARTGVFINN